MNRFQVVEPEHPCCWGAKIVDTHRVNLAGQPAWVLECDESDAEALCQLLERAQLPTAEVKS